MKRLFKTLTIILLVVACAFTVFACDGGEGSSLKKGLTLKKGTGEDLYTLYRYIDEGKGLTVLNLGEKAGEQAIGRIVSGAFDGDSKLVEVIIPSTVTEIQAGALRKMSALNKITIPFVGTNANADAFIGQTEAKEDKAVNEKRTFAYIFGNEEYGYGAKITSNYGSGTEDRYIPVNLQEVVVSPSADYQIPAYGFAGVKLVETITLGDKVIAIGENAFSGCRDLTSVYLSATVKIIYQNAFEGCDGLTVINFAGTLSDWAKVEKKDGWAGETIEVVKCSDGLITVER